MRYKVIVAIRSNSSEPWDFRIGPVAQFIDAERALRFGKSEVRDGWHPDRVRVMDGRKILWPRKK